VVESEEWTDFLKSIVRDIPAELSESSFTNPPTKRTRASLVDGTKPRGRGTKRQCLQADLAPELSLLCQDGSWKSSLTSKSLQLASGKGITMASAVRSLDLESQVDPSRLPLDLQRALQPATSADVPVIPSVFSSDSAKADATLTVKENMEQCVIEAQCHINAEDDNYDFSDDEIEES